MNDWLRAKANREELVKIDGFDEPVTKTGCRSVVSLA
jgi:hypothetical protein